MAPEACTTTTMEAPVWAVSSDSTLRIFELSVFPPS
jgi:hypothetical protein